MAAYLISYDQHRDRDYTPIWTLLRNSGAVRILESVWFLDSNLSVGSIRESIRQTTHNEDSLLVIQLFPGTEWATYAAQAEGNQWLQANIRQYQPAS